MQHKINYQRILTLLAVAAAIVTILIYVSLKENDVEEYVFVGDWNCMQKDSTVPMHLQLTDSSIFENNKKLYDYYPKTSQLKENTYNLYKGDERFARIKEITPNKISFKKNIKDAKSYYCKRNLIVK